MITAKTDNVIKLSSSLLISLVWVSILSVSACSDPVPETQEGQARVGINTLREPFHKSDHVCGEYPPDYLEFLDDTKCQKILPSQRDREFQCLTAKIIPHS